MTKKSLILLAVVLSVTLVVLVLLLARMEQKTANQGIKIGTNQKMLIDYEENVQQYGDTIYILDTIRKQILLFEPDTGDRKVIRTFGQVALGNRLLIRQNRLYYSYDNVTYTADLDGSNEERFVNGELVYMNDDVFVVVQRQESNDSVIVTNYSLSSGKLINGVSKSVAHGHEISFLKSEENRVFFTSQNQQNVLSLFEVNMENATVTVIDQMNALDEENAVKNSYANVTKTERGYYMIKDVYYFTTESDWYQYSYLYVDDEYYYHRVGRNLAKIPQNNAFAVYEYYSEDSNEMVLSYIGNDEYQWQDLFFGDVSNHFQLENQELLMDHVRIGEVAENEMSLEKAIHVGDAYYLWLTDDGNSVWYRYIEKENKLLKI